MCNPFDDERHKATEEPKITDQRGRNAFELSLTKIIDSRSASDAYQTADMKRLGNPSEQHEAAYTYLALAFRLIKNQLISVQSNSKKLTAAEMFHFAGHAFREVGQLNRAADAYWRSGVIGDKITDFSLRSLARAKSCYGEIGETDKSDAMHFLEWEARRILSGGLVIWIWKGTVTAGGGKSRCSRWGK